MVEVPVWLSSKETACNVGATRGTGSITEWRRRDFHELIEGLSFPYIKRPLLYTWRWNQQSVCRECSISSGQLSVPLWLGLAHYVVDFCSHLYIFKINKNLSNAKGTGAYTLAEGFSCLLFGIENVSVWLKRKSYGSSKIFFKLPKSSLVASVKKFV